MSISGKDDLSCIGYEADLSSYDLYTDDGISRIL
jgi:hypothetical protein